MIIEIIRVMIGTSLALFIPGYLVTLIFFKEFTPMQKIALAITFSIMISVTIGIFLGYNEDAKNLTGGITSGNVWFYSIIVTMFLLVFYLFTRKNQTLIKKNEN